MQKPAQRHALVGKNTDKISSSKHFANNRPIRKRSHQKATQGSATLPVQPHHQFGHIPVQAEMLATIKSKLDQRGITGESKAVSQADQNFGIPTKCRNQHSVETNAAHHPKIGSYQIARLDKRHSRSAFPCRTNTRRVPFYCINISHWDTVNECDVWFTFPIVPTVCRFALRCSKRLKVACGWIQAACSYQPIDQANSGWVVDY